MGSKYCISYLTVIIRFCLISLVFWSVGGVGDGCWNIKWKLYYMSALQPLPVRATGCSQPRWFMRNRFQGQGNWVILGRVSGWEYHLAMSRGVWEAQQVAVEIYNLSDLNHRAHREHIEYRVFLPFSVSSVNSVVNIWIIFYPTYSSMKHAPLMLHSLWTWAAASPVVSSSLCSENGYFI